MLLNHYGVPDNPHSAAVIDFSDATISPAINNRKLASGKHCVHRMHRPIRNIEKVFINFRAATNFPHIRD